MKLIHRENEYASHQPVLIDIIRRTTGPVLELGAGEGSTELLHHLCKADRRSLLTVDDNAEWIDKYRDRLHSADHEFICAPLPGILDRREITGRDWEIVFLDQGEWISRAECLMYFKDRVKFIILHDSLYYPENGIFGKIISLGSFGVRVAPGSEVEAVATYDDVFKFYKEYYPVRPWNSQYGIMTLVGSNFEPVPESIDMSILEI